MMRKNNQILIFVLISLFVFSCGKKTIYSESVSLPGSVWNCKNILKFDADITQTDTPFSIIFNLEHGDLYEKSNLWLFVKIVSPNGLEMKDTLEFPLFDASGKCLGKEHRKNCSQRLLFKNNVGFPEKGTYRFEVEHGMRKQNLDYINNFGIEIIEAN